jgi:membrane protein implicated in regulation of membrane protease activity
MAPQWVWWVLGLALVAAELVTGTFYLFAIGIAFLVAGVAASFGVPVGGQLIVTAVLALVGTALAHRWRRRMGAPAAPPPLDLGHAVQVQSWHADGTARVSYRGTHWNAVLAAPDAAREKTMYIVGVRGSTLVLAPQRPQP